MVVVPRSMATTRPVAPGSDQLGIVGQTGMVHCSTLSFKGDSRVRAAGQPPAVRQLLRGQCSLIFRRGVNVALNDLHPASAAGAQPAAGKFHAAGHEHIVQNGSAIYFQDGSQGNQLNPHLGWGYHFRCPAYDSGLPKQRFYESCESKFCDRAH